MERVIFAMELAKVININKYFGVGKVILFGSCLEEVESARDIDIAVKGGNPEEFIEGCGGVPLDATDFFRLFVGRWRALEAHRR
jgi:predicted nucleotidyltransferase